jgi:hypothetical protein
MGIQQLTSSVRLQQVSVGTCAKSLFHHLLSIVLANEENANLRRNFVNLVSCFDAPDSRQRDIEQNYIREMLLGLKDSAIRC